MGIKSLSQFLRKNYPAVFEPVSLAAFRYKKVAIDISLYMCNYKAMYGEADWLGAFVRLITCLRANDIHCVFIYDSGCPPEKNLEKQERKEARQKTESRIGSVEEALEKYLADGSVLQVLVDFQKQRKIHVMESLLAPSDVPTINVEGISAALEKSKQQMFTITADDFALTRKLFDIMKVPYFNAPLEAETMCSDLCIQGKVDAVLSEDTDVLAYGAPTFLTKIDTRRSTCYQIRIQAILQAMQLTQKQFLDFCIMCGTDYNKNVPGIGPAKALKLIAARKSIEEIGIKESKIDISVLNHVRTRQLFTDYKKAEHKIPFCDIPDFPELNKFLFQHNIQVDLTGIKKNFETNVTFVVDGSEESSESYDTKN